MNCQLIYDFLIINSLPWQNFSRSCYTEAHMIFHDDVIKWKHFPRYWPFVRGIHRSPVKFPHKGQWRGAVMFSLICVCINGWVNNRKAGDLRRHRTHYYVSVMHWPFYVTKLCHDVIWATRHTFLYFILLIFFQILKTKHCLTLRYIWQQCYMQFAFIQTHRNM